ncbi:hypothetical protein HMPREF3092_02530 [Brevibacterium sp. HMSC24B04]|nr:hypothetical protein HMPREF3092_02530 [Brevibacterium sp. HMSC24B04]
MVGFDSDTALIAFFLSFGGYNDVADQSSQLNRPYPAWFQFRLCHLSPCPLQAWFLVRLPCHFLLAVRYDGLMKYASFGPALTVGLVCASDLFGVVL